MEHGQAAHRRNMLSVFHSQPEPVPHVVWTRRQGPFPDKENRVQPHSTSQSRSRSYLFLEQPRFLLPQLRAVDSVQWQLVHLEPPLPISLHTG
eukprot:341201-Rhodomonas_salina.1